MYHGSCLCGNVKFSISNTIEDIVHCHCSLCRKAQGGAFAINTNVKTKNFILLQGEENLSPYQSSPAQTKYFCKACGSPIMSKNSAVPDNVRIRLGTIESDISERPAAHIFVSSKANRETICDDLPKY